MHVTAAGKGYYCDDCDSSFTFAAHGEPGADEFIEGDVYREDLGSDVYESYHTVWAWCCPNGCDHVEQDEDDVPCEDNGDELWQCGKCEKLYTNEHVAVKCCKDEE